MRRTRKNFLLTGFIVVLFCLNSLAQTSEKEKISVEIVTETDGKREVFKKSYDSMEEMNADPEYQKLNSSQNKSISWNSSKGDGKGQNHFRFKFEDGDTTKKNVVVRIIEDDDDFTWETNDGKMMLRSFDKFDFSDFESIPDRMVAWIDKIKNDTILAKKIEDGMKDIEKSIEIRAFADRDAFEKHRKRNTNENFTTERFFGSKNLVLLDLDPTKDANYIKANKINIDKPAEVSDIELSTLGSKKFELKLDITNEKPLSVRITAANGSVVYLESIEAFKGKYIRTVDLSGEPGKEYFVEIATGKDKTVKRLLLD